MCIFLTNYELRLTNYEPRATVVHETVPVFSPFRLQDRKTLCLSTRDLYFTIDAFQEFLRLYAKLSAKHVCLENLRESSCLLTEAVEEMYQRGRLVYRSEDCDDLESMAFMQASGNLNLYEAFGCFIEEPRLVAEH